MKRRLLYTILSISLLTVMAGAAIALSLCHCHLYRDRLPPSGRPDTQEADAAGNLGKTALNSNLLN